MHQCPVTLDDLARAKEVGAEMLQAMSPSRSKELDEAKDLRQRAAEHLRCGLEEVRAAARYVFRDDEAKLERYPSLFVLRSRRGSGGDAEDETSVSTDEGPSIPTPEVSETPGTTDDQPSQGLEASAPDA